MNNSFLLSSPPVTSSGYEKGHQRTVTGLPDGEFACVRLTEEQSQLWIGYEKEEPATVDKVQESVVRRKCSEAYMKWS